MTGHLALIATLVLAWPIFYRTVTVLWKASRRGYGGSLRYQGFAIGYAALGGLTIFQVADALAGHPIPLLGLGYMLASDFLILCYDRRRTDDT
ncbi:MAG TPA: hypothetical protein VGK09_08435 [Rhodocyclaceae bacterium]|jgi:hypothetical protein